MFPNNQITKDKKTKGRPRKSKTLSIIRTTVLPKICSFNSKDKADKVKYLAYVILSHSESPYYAKEGGPLAVSGNILEGCKPISLKDIEKINPESLRDPLASPDVDLNTFFSKHGCKCSKAS